MNIQVRTYVLLLLTALAAGCEKQSGLEPGVTYYATENSPRTWVMPDGKGGFRPMTAEELRDAGLKNYPAANQGGGP